MPTLDENIAALAQFPYPVLAGADDHPEMHTILHELVPQLKIALDGKVTQAEINTAIAALVDGAPVAFDTLKELAAYAASDQTGMATLTELVQTKQTQEPGKGLSSNDYVTTDKNKLAGIAAGATANRSDTATDSIITAAVTKPKLRTNARLLCVGDSLTAYALTTMSGSFTNNGYATWLNLLLGGRLNQAINGGVGGNQTGNVLARLGVLLDSKPDAVVLLIGTNNTGIAGMLPALTLADISLITETFTSLGVPVIVVTNLPRYAPNALSTGQENYRVTINTGIMALSGPLVFPLNVESVMSNAALYEDGLHTNSRGAYALAQPIAALLNSWMDTTANATKQITLDKSLSPNLLLTGTTGGKNGTATGNVATSWTLLQTNSGGATVAGSKTTTANLNQQVITVSGNYSGDNRYVGLLGNQAVGSLVTPGQTIENFVDFEVLAAMTGVATICVNTTFNNSGGYISDFYSFYNNDANAFPLGVGRYQMRSNPLIVPAGTTSIDTHLMIRLLPAASSSPVAANVKLHRLASIVVN